MKKSLVYLQSGGPTCVINCSLYGVIMESKKSEDIDHIYGSIHGVEGLINDELVDLNEEDQNEIELLKQTPGAALGSTRYRLPSDTNEVFKKIASTITKHNIGYILLNGGNDSMDTCSKLSIFFASLALDVKVLGIPKTIDNDLAITDHSVGYPSAAKHIINTIQESSIDNHAYSNGKVLICEIMGRNAGWLTASVDLLDEKSRPDLIYLPEMEWDEANFLKEVQKIYAKKGEAVVAVSEGLPVSHHNDQATDGFGHASLEGVSITLGDLVKNQLGIKTRTMELSLPQRSDPVLASKIDKEEAERCGRYAVQSVLQGETGKMVCLKRLGGGEMYSSDCFLYDVTKIANYEKLIPSEFIKDIHHMDARFREYLLPLLKGEDHLIFENGIIKNSHLKLHRI
jgi:6-phosphofructokinase 1